VSSVLECNLLHIVWRKASELAPETSGEGVPRGGMNHFR
jgi:hypothetical protein